MRESENDNIQVLKDALCSQLDANSFPTHGLLL